MIALVSVLALLAAWTALAAMGAAATQARGAAWQAREVESLATAETGLAWTLARLNETHRHDDACDAVPRPGGAGGHLPLLERLLARDAGGRWVAAGAGSPAVTCVRRDDRWRCDCTGSPAGLVVAVGAEPRQAFQVAVEPASTPDGRPVARLVVRGCIRPDGDCARPSRAGEMPSRRVQVDLAVADSLVAVPSGLWTATGDVTLGAGTVARNVEPASAGLVVHAGAGAQHAGARLVGQAGAPPADAVAAADGWLAAHDFDGLAARLLGRGPTDFAALPGVSAVACGASAAGCASPVAVALANGARVLHVDGPWQPEPGLVLGNPDRPVLVVVDGPVRLVGPAVVHGLVVSRDIEVDGRGGPVLWRGAAAAAGPITVRGAVDAARSSAVLSSIASLPAAVVTAPGSWRDVAGGAP